MLRQTYQRRHRRKRVVEVGFQQITESVQLKKMERYVQIITAWKRSLGQGNIFTPVSHSVHRGESASVHAGIPPPPQTGHTPLDQTPQTRHPHLPRPDTPRPRTPPGAEHAGRYGQRAGGTHSPGMQAYIIIFLRFIGIRLAFVVTPQILTDAIMNYKMSFYTILYFFPLCGQTQARDLLPGGERTIIVKIEDHTGGTISSEGKYNLVQVKNVTILVICCTACIECRYYMKLTWW